MSVLIKGMKMPKDCGECFFYDEAHNWCEAKDNHLHNAKDETNRAIWCPLIEVPTPHGRLIDADELLRHKGDAYDSEGHLLYAVGTGSIIAAPTIIEAEEGEPNA